MKNNNINNDYDNVRLVRDDLERLLSISEQIPEDMEHFNQWIKDNPYAGEVVDKLSSTELLHRAIAEYRGLDARIEVQTERLLASIRKQQGAMLRRNRIIKTIISSVAAVVLVSLMLFYAVDRYNDVHDSLAMVGNGTDTLNSSDKPVLILDDGTRVDFGKLVVAQTNVKTSKVSENKISLKMAQSKINTVIVPKMYCQKIVLEDSTEVWINASSKLIYPAKFGGDSREVLLVGEAYFKVKKSNKPFIVHTDGADIKVYGTEFNIKSSKNQVATVLVRGSVGVKPKGMAEVMLTPDRMAVVDNNGKCVVTDVDTRRYVAAINGFFRLDEEPMSIFIEDIENWYAVRFVGIGDKLLNSRVCVSLSRSMSLSEIIVAVESLTQKRIINEGGGTYRVEE